MEIKLLPNLDFSPYGMVSYHNKSLKTENRLIHLQQGDLDGACGPYSLMMALLAYGAITRKDAINLWLGKIKTSTKFGKVVSKLDVLLRNGTEPEHLEEIFEAIKAYSQLNKLTNRARLQNLNLTKVEVRGRRLFHKIKASIDLGLPMIVGLKWGKNSGHWVAAIGYQSFKKDHTDALASSKMESILVLDPGARFSSTSAWNGVLSIFPQNGPLPFQYWTDDMEETQCDADEGLVFKLST